MIRQRFLSSALVASLLLTLFVPRSAFAVGGGINLSWNDCGTAGVADRASACAVNSGTNAIVGSFVPPPGLTKLVAMQAFIEIQVNGTSVPDWWQMRAGTGKRPSSISAQFAFPSLSTCTDYWQGQAIGGMDYAPGVNGPNRCLVRLVCACAPDVAAPTSTSTEYYVFQLLINNSRSTAADGCPGCTSPACILFNSLELYQSEGVEEQTISTPIDRSMVTWQGGSCSGGTRKGSFSDMKKRYR